MRSLPLIALFITTSVFACPDLSGKYKSCKSTSGEATEGVTFSQTTISGVTIYSTESINSETGESEIDSIAADGVVRSQTEDDGYQSSSKAYCKGDTLVMEGTFQQGKTSGTTIAEVRKVDGKLTTKVSAKVAGQDYQDTMICE